VDRYMPAYQTYLPALYTRGPQRSTARPELLQPVPGAVADSARATRSSGSGSGVDEGALCSVLKVSCCHFAAQYFSVLVQIWC